MNTQPTGRLVILSGPSCAGKSPLAKALRRFYPELCRDWQRIVLLNARPPRLGERDGVDYHFRARRQIEALRDQERYVVRDVRGDLQALDLDDLRERLSGGDAFYEGNAFVARVLLTHPALAELPRLSLFLTPLSKEEISFLKAKTHVVLADWVTEVMRRKLLRRARRQKGELSLADLEDIERRAGSAYREMQEAPEYDHVIPNHDGEDSEHWEAFYYPLGEARQTLLAAAALLRGETTDRAETWEADLVT